MTELVPKGVSGWQLQADSTRTYDRETIFDYINGAGEVFRSYAFQEVQVSRYAKDGAPVLTVELFDMGKPEDAYGVFSHARESEETGIGAAYESRGDFICFWQAQYFVCVMADGHSDETGSAVDSLARLISGNLPELGDRPAVVRKLPAEGLKGGTVRFFHLPVSLNYHYFLAEDNILKLSEETNAVLAPYDGGSTYLLCIEYPSAGDASDALGSFVEGYAPELKEADTAETEPGKWIGSRLLDNNVLIALDASSSERARELLESASSRLSE